MSTVVEIEHAIDELPPEQREEIRRWMGRPPSARPTREMTREQVREYMRVRSLPEGPMSPITVAEVVSWARGDH